MKTIELVELAEKNNYEFKRGDTRLVLTKTKPGSQTTIEISRTFTNIIWIKSYGFPDDADMDMVEGAIAYTRTPLEDREPEKEKRYIIPLPGLITSKGDQQYLTHKDGHFFASRRNEVLRQTWKEEHLCHVPYQYRGYAVEVEE